MKKKTGQIVIKIHCRRYFYLFLTPDFGVVTYFQREEAHEISWLGGHRGRDFGLSSPPVTVIRWMSLLLLLLLDSGVEGNWCPDGVGMKFLWFSC